MGTGSGTTNSSVTICIATSKTVSEAGSAIQKAGKISREEQNVSAAEDNLTTYQQQLTDLQTSLHEELAKLTDVDKMNIEKYSIKVRKTDSVIEPIAILWWPLAYTSSE